jgi:hypothetical protein
MPTSTIPWYGHPALIERLGNAAQARDTLRLDRLDDGGKLPSSVELWPPGAARSVGSSCDFELELEPKAVGTAPESRQPNQNDEPATSPAPKPAELLTLKPGIWGMSFDLKEAWRRAMRWWRGSN